MAATISIRVYTGTTAATESAAVTGIDFVSADNATNSLGNRQANPINAGANSFEKWLKAKVDAAPDNKVENWKFWTDGAMPTNTTLYAGTATSGATPTDANSTVATVDAATYTSGAKLTWDTAALTTLNAVTKYLVLQLRVASNAAPGNWGSETLNYSYDES